jgi:hypothetical protein
MNWLKSLLRSFSGRAAVVEDAPAPPPQTDEEVINLKRKFASKYAVDGWDVDSTPELHLSIMHDLQVYGFCLAAGAVLRVSHEPAIPAPVAIHVRGVTICPKCAGEQRFIANIYRIGPSLHSECHTNRCMKCDVLVDMHICMLWRLESNSEFYLTARRHDELQPSTYRGAWTVCSSRIDGIRVFDRECTEDERDEHFKWLNDR